MRNIMVRRFLVRALLVAFAGLMLVMMLVAHAHPNDWLIGPASPTMVKTCALIAIAYYAAIALFVFVQTQREKLRNVGKWADDMAQATASPNVVPMGSRARGDNPPTQPIPVAPDDEAVGED